MTRSPTSVPASTERVPSVLAVLVVRDDAEHLKTSLAALAAQSYPRLAVMAVDDASSDGSHALLVQALGEGRVIRLETPQGPTGAFRAAMGLPVASAADQILMLRADTVLDEPDDVARMVEAAVGITGIDRVGIVGAKVVDRDDPRLLRDVGRSADRFGHPYAPLQPGEIDQGQFDRVLEVLGVSSAAMLISRDAWQRIGPFDERLPIASQDLDLGWRARIGGFRVLMTPLARVRSGATEPPVTPPHRSARYDEDRAAICSTLKYVSFLNLLWLLPLSLLLALVRVLFLVLGRRFEEAYDVLAAWGWNVANLGGTFRRRRRAQRIRLVKDGSLRRFMASGGMRSPRWFQTAERILEEQREIYDEEEDVPASRRLRHRTTSFVGAHPVIVGSFLGLVVGAFAIRHLVGPSSLAGGVLPAFPPKTSGFFGELLSGYRTTGLGGPLAASPALGAMGALSALVFDSTRLAQKVLLAGAPVLAGTLMYRSTVRLTGRAGPSVVAAGAYLASALMLWAFSQGRIDLLLGLAVLPPAAERLETAFGRDEPTDGRWRFVAGVGVTIAVLLAFLPGAALALLLLVLVQLVSGRNRGRGLALTGTSLLVAAVLLFPFVPTLLAGGGAALTSYIGTTEVRNLARLSLGSAPGGWWVAAFLPVAAIVGYGLTGPAMRGRATRSLMAALGGLTLSWLSAAGYLPAALSDPMAYAAVAAVGEATLIGFGLSSVGAGLGRESFGLRQIGMAVLAVVLTGGLALQAAAAIVGGWAVGGPEQVPAAWAVVESGATGTYRVLWVGGRNGQPFPAPGGDPTGVLQAGDATLRWALTDRVGTTALDTGRSLTGPGEEALAEAMNEILSGTSSHGGALLAPFGIRYVVASLDELPAAASRRLGQQLDLDVVPAAGLAIYRNAVALPPGAVVAADPAQSGLVYAGTPAATAELGRMRARPMVPVTGGWDGPAVDGLALLSTEYDGAWGVEGTDATPRRSFGWATAFARTRGPIAVRYGAQLARTIEIALLGALWLAALWITRKPVSR
jgi:GT2 family glycosyltransferase